MFFTWIYRSHRDHSADLVLCERNGVRIYKIQEDKILLREVKMYDISCTSVWYDPAN